MLCRLAKTVRAPIGLRMASVGPTIIDGNATAATIRAELKERISAASALVGRSPGLAVVLVGARPDSATYVRMKKKAVAEVGAVDFGRDLPESATTAEIISTVEELNADPRVDGILVQLPLPAHVDETAVLDCISQDKDADGLHPSNMGCLVLKGRVPKAVACTPAVSVSGKLCQAGYWLRVSVWSALSVQEHSVLASLSHYCTAP
jgi:5,10-methylene-tetrahydrofolate dehydrogenase/methenyl tetrahydrofolate cyclohydrolase